jgi:hypothetical protein
MAKDPSFKWTKESRRAAARKAGGGSRGAAGPWTNVATKSYKKMSNVAYTNAMSEAKAANLAKGSSSLTGMHSGYMDKMGAMKRQLAGGGGLALNQLENQLLQGSGGLGFHNYQPMPDTPSNYPGGKGPGYSSSRKGLTDLVKKMGGKGGMGGMMAMLMMMMAMGMMGGGDDEASLDNLLG